MSILQVESAFDSKPNNGGAKHAGAQSASGISFTRYYIAEKKNRVM
jgi:hypothetical protein